MERRTKVMGDGSRPTVVPPRRRADAGGRLAPVLELVDQQLPPELQQRCDGFLGRYFQHLSSLDLKARQPRDLLGAALAHLRLGEVRTEGTANVHVFNPDLAANGWQSAHTVVQVVTDDMPFLVDSVRMVMTAMGLGIHLVIHPMLRVVRDDGTYVRDEDGTANEAWIYLEVDRCDAGPSGAAARAPARRARRRPRSRSPIGGRCGTAATSSPTIWSTACCRSARASRPGRRSSCAGSATTTSSSSATGSTSSSTRTRTTMSSSPCPVPGSASSATAGGRRSRTGSRRSRRRPAGWCSRRRS